MSIIGSANLFVAKNSRSGYKIERSLRFNSADSAYLNRTPASAGNRKTWTWSGWVKRSGLGSGAYTLLGSGPASNTDFFYLGYQYSGNADQLVVIDYPGASSLDLRTSVVYRDTSAWYHVVLAYDTTQANSSDRAKLYVNGTQVTAFGTAIYPSQNSDGRINSTNVHYVGAARFATSPVHYFDGYLTEINFIDGQALTPSSFGETDVTTGVWKPKKYAGTYGTNGFYLNFSDNSGTTSTTLGKDSSGNGNNWTPNNFSVTAGAGNDSLIDTPTPYADGGNGRGNYCTLNPLDTFRQGTLTNGNLDNNAVSNALVSSGTIFIAAASGNKFYWEWVYESGPNYACGISAITGATIYSNSIRLDESDGGNATVQAVGIFAGATIVTNPSTTTTAGDVIGVAYDPNAGTIKWTKNGSTFAEASGVAAADVTPICGRASSSGPQTTKFTVNFGQRPFAYTPPSGFVALNTQNLPTPSIKKPGSYFNTVLYTGTAVNPGDTQSVTGVGFAPDLVWIKRRENANSHHWTDIVRGAAKYIQSNVTDAEVTTNINGNLSSFDNNGFTCTYGSSVGSLTCQNGGTYVAWCWDESATPGFDIVTFTSDGVTAGGTFAHSLGVAPKMIIYKGRNTVDNWYVYHASIGPNSAVFLNLTTGSSATGVFNNADPTSSVIQLRQSSWGAGNLVAYCFSEVAGFSKFGSYTGNGSADGPFVYCGFRPRWIMVKATAGAEDWVMLDTARNTYNVMNERLYADSASIPSVADLVDFTASGFKIRNSGVNDMNTSGRTYIFCAWAETPFKYALAR